MENFSIKIDENVRLRLYKICRLCGDDSPNNTDILANNKKSTNVDPDFHKKIFDCIGIQVTKGDKMPQTACDVCREKINDFFDFREMCLATDVQTRRLLGLPETVVPKPDPALDAIEDDKTEVEKTIKKKNPIAIKALKGGKVLKSERKNPIELRKGSLDARRSFPETRRSSLQETKKTALPDIKKAPPDIKKGPPETRKNQVDIKKGPPETRRSLLESKNKNKTELKKIPPDVKKPPADIKKPIVEVKKPPADVKKSLEVKKPPADVKKTPLDVKKVVKLEREKAQLKMKKKVQINVHQMPNAELKKKFKDDPDRLARAKKRKASGDLLTEKPPNKRERLRDTIVRKFNNPEIALDTVATNVKCKICTKPFCNAGELHRHLDTDHLPRVVTFHCIRCNESLEKKQDIKDHNLWHKLSKTPYECGRCAKTITNLAVYTKHVQNCSGFIQDFVYKTKVCPICKEEFQTQNLYNWHKCIINQLKCEVCQQKFTKKGAMVKHVVRCSAIGLNTSLPVVDSAIEPDPEPEAEPPAEMNDHFGDDDDNDEDDTEMNLKLNLEIDIEVPREEPEPEAEPEPEPEKEEEKEAVPFVVIPTPAVSSEISRPSSNSSSSVAAANSIPSRTPSIHSNIADDDASNASNVQTGNVVTPMVCIKFESTLRNAVPAETNNPPISNVAGRVKAEVIDSSYRGLYDNTTGQIIKTEQTTEEDPGSGEASPPHSPAAASDDIDEAIDDLPDGGASSRSVTPPPSPVPETNLTPAPKPTLKLVIKKQHGTLNSSFVAGSDVPRDEGEVHPKKKKKKKVKIFKIPKGLALRLRQEKLQEGSDERNDEANDGTSSETNNENEEEEEHLQDTLPVISNVCSKYTDENTEKHPGVVAVAGAVEVRIKQERLDHDDNTENRATDESVSASATEEQEEEEEVASQNALPVITKVFSKHIKAKSRVKNPLHPSLGKTFQIKQERLDDGQQNSVSDNATGCHNVEMRIKRERVDNDDEVSSNSNISDNTVSRIHIKQEREDVEITVNSSEDEATENDNESERNQLIRQKSRETIKIATRNTRLKRIDRRTENLVQANVQIKQERPDEAEEDTNDSSLIAESNEDLHEVRQEKGPAMSKARSKLANSRRLEVNPANKTTLDTNVRIKQERLDPDNATDVQRNSLDETTQDISDSVDTNVEKRRGRSSRNKEAPKVSGSVRVKEETIDNDEAGAETEEQDSNISNENLVGSAVLVTSSLRDKTTRNTSDNVDSNAEKRRGKSLRNKVAPDVNVRVKEERIDSDQAEEETEEQDSNISSEKSVAPASNKSTSRDKTTRNTSDSASIRAEKRQDRILRSKEAPDVNVRVKEERIDSLEAEDEHDSNISDENSIIPASDKSTSRDKTTRNTSYSVESSSKKRQGSSLRSKEAYDANVLVKEERIDSDEAEMETDEHDSNISNENSVIPVSDKSTSGDKMTRNNSDSVDSYAGNRRGKSLRSKVAPDINVRVKEERIDSDEAEEETEGEDLNISNEKPVAPVSNKSTSRDKTTRNTSDSVSISGEKRQDRILRSKEAPDVDVRVKEERIDSDEAEDEHDSNICDENLIIPASDKSTSRYKTTRNISDSVESSSKKPQGKSLRSKESYDVNVRVKEERIDSDEAEMETDEHDSNISDENSVIPVSDKSTSGDKMTRNTSDNADSYAGKRRSKSLRSKFAPDINVRVKEERIDSDEAEEETEGEDLNISNENPVVPVLSKSTLRDKTTRNTSDSVSISAEKRQDRILRSKEAPDVNIRVKEERIDSDEAEDDHNSNISDENSIIPASDKSTSRDKTTRNTSDSVDSNVDKRQGKSLRNKDVPDVNVRVKEERIDSDEADEETEEHDLNISNENSVVPVSHKSTSRDKTTQNTSDSVGIRAEKRRSRILRSKEAHDVNVRIKEERIDSDEAEPEIDEHDSNISQETPAVRLSGKTISTEPESASCHKTASLVDQVSEIRVKEEHMDSEDDEQNVDYNLEASTTVLISNTKKKQPSKSKPKKSDGTERANISVDGNVRVKQERSNAEEPETNLSTAVPIISQVFSQHIKSENDENTRQEKSTPNITQENIRIKEEKQDNEICIIDSDDEDDEVVIAQHPNIPFISLLSPDRSEPDPKERPCINVEAASSLPTKVSVKQERMDTDECNVIIDIDTENEVNVAASSSLLSKKTGNNKNVQVNDNSLNKNIRKRQDSGDASDSGLVSAQKSRKAAQTMRKILSKTVSAEKLPTEANEVATKSVNKRVSGTIDDVTIKEERVDDDDDEPEVQLVDLTEIIEIPDESEPVIVQPQAKRQKLNKQHSTPTRIAHEDPDGQARIKKEIPEMEESEQDIDPKIINRSTTVINPLAARLKRLSRKRKNINPLNPANLGLLQTRIKRERVDDSFEGSPVADRLDSTSLEEMNISTSEKEAGSEIGVNEINSERISVRVKEEPVDSTISRDEPEPNASDIVNQIHSKSNSKGKGFSKQIVRKASCKPTEIVVNDIAPPISTTLNTGHDLAEKSIPTSEEPRPMLRIKSEFNTFNFSHEEDHRTATDSSSNTGDLDVENQIATDSLVIKAEPIFDASIKEELADSDDDDDDQEEPDCDAAIKEEPLEFSATEEMQAPLSEGSNLVERGHIKNTLNEGPDITVGGTKTNIIPDNTEGNVIEETSKETISEPLATEEPSTEEAPSAIETVQEISVSSRIYSDVEDPVLEDESTLRSVVGDQTPLNKDKQKEYTNVNSEINSEQKTYPVIEDPVLERGDSVVLEQTPMDEKTRTEDTSLHLQGSSEQNVYLSLETVGLEGESIPDSVVAEQAPMDEGKSLNLEGSRGQKVDNTVNKIESPSTLPNSEDKQGFPDTLNPAEILVDNSNVIPINCQTSESVSLPVDEVLNLIEKPIEIPIMACAPTSEMKDISHVEKMEVDDAEEDTCDKVSSTHITSDECEKESIEQVLPQILTDARVNEDTNDEVSAENISTTLPTDEEKHFAQCIASEVDSAQNPSTSLEKVTQDEHESSLIEKKRLEIMDGVEAMSIDTSLENSSSIDQGANEHHTESSMLGTENVQSHNDTDQNVTVGSGQMTTSEDVQTDESEYKVQCENTKIQVDAIHANSDDPNENDATNIEADNSMNEHVSNEENTTNNDKSEQIVANETENRTYDGHPIDGKDEINDPRFCAEDASTLDTMENQETESDEKISDYDNATQESENVDECSEIEDSENNLDCPENDSDSNCNQKLKDLIKDNDNLLGFFEHELSRNNDSSSEERSMDHSTRDQGEDSPKEPAGNLEEDSKTQSDGNNSVNSSSTVENESCHSENAGEKHCSEEQPIEAKNDTCENLEVTTEGKTSSEMAVSQCHDVADDCNLASPCNPLDSGSKSDLSQSNITAAASIEEAAINLSVTPVPDITQMSTQPIQNINPPANFSINTLIGSALVPSSSMHSTTVAPSITALPKAIVSPGISPSMSSYNAPPLNVLDRVPTIPFIGPPIGGNVFNPSGNPVSSLHSIESPNNLSVIPPFISSNISNQLPTSPSTPSVFPNTSGQSSFNSRLINESLSGLNMLHINEIAENNNNANIERELQNDLETISSGSNVDFDETTENSIDDVSELNTLTSANNIDNAALDH